MAGAAGRPARAGGQMIAAYRKFRGDSKGWGHPSFDVFRARLWPLRAKRVWTDDEMALVMQLESEGAAWALQELFDCTGARGNPVARGLLGESPRDAEPMTVDDLDAHLRSLVRDCRKNRWRPAQFEALIDYLDSDKTPADLADAAPAESQPQPRAAPAEERDLFAEAYRGASEAFRRRVRETLARAAAAPPP